MRASIGFFLAVAVCVASVSWAQERREERREEGTVRRELAGAKQAGWSADQQIAALLFVCARNEVELSKFAQEKATSEEVRSFAEMMVTDHSPELDKLQKAAGPLASAHAPGTPAAGVRKEVIREETREIRRDPAAPEDAAPPRRVAVEEKTIEARPAGTLDWVSIHKQIADQCLASTKAEFQKKNGAEFDRCYVGQQIMAHAVKLDELKVLRNYAGPELRKDIDEATEIATRHLAEAKKLAESMMKADATERVSRKPKAE
jgi:predicted outer membrane protein